MNTTIPASGTYMKVRQVVGVDFRPFYTPEVMLTLGIQQGAFGNDDLAELYEINPNLTRRFRPTNKWGLTTPDPAINYFQVVAIISDRALSGNADVYKKMHPLGWFQWYCEYYYGKKSQADVMRVVQWQIGINTAWFYIKQDPSKLTDLTWQKPYRQALLEWGVDPTLDPDSYGCGDIL